MADYHPLIARAVEGLGAGSGEARRALYERARAALVSQLRGIDPPLSEADITRERLALEDAIRKVEAEAVRRSRAEPRQAPPSRPNSPAPRPEAPPPPPPAQPAPPPRRERVGPSFGEAQPAPRPELQRPEPPPRGPADFVPDEAANPPPQSSARSRLLNARTSPVSRDGLKGFRNVVNEVEDLGSASARAAKSARDTRDSYPSPSPQHHADDDELSPMRGKVEPRFAEDDSGPSSKRCSREWVRSNRPTTRKMKTRRSRRQAREPMPEITKITTKSRARRDPIAAGLSSPWW